MADTDITKARANTSQAPAKGQRAQQHEITVIALRHINQHIIHRFTWTSSRRSPHIYNTMREVRHIWNLRDR